MSWKALFLFLFIITTVLVIIIIIIIIIITIIIISIIIILLLLSLLLLLLILLLLLLLLLSCLACLTGVSAGFYNLPGPRFSAPWICDPLPVTPYHQRIPDCWYHHHQLLPGQPPCLLPPNSSL